MDAGTIITACAGTLTPLGTAGAFIWRKVERRIDTLETKLDECERQHQRATSIADKLTMAAQMLADEVQVLNPGSGALLLVQRILGDTFKLRPTPVDMIETVGKIA